MPSLNILVVQHLSEQQVLSISEVDENVNVIQCTSDEAINHIEDADILISWGDLNFTELLPKAKRLKWVHALSAGVETYLVPELTQSEIILTNSRGIHGIPMAEHVLAMMLSFTRGISVARRQQKEKIWQPMHLEELYEKSIAIIGLGSVGREIAKRAKCIGMKVLAAKRTVTTELFVDKLYTTDQLPHLLSIADFIVVTLPLTPQTKGLFTLETFQQMKKSAYFINVARGAIVNEADLVTALQAKVIRGAGLDVFEEEPLPEDSPLWELDNVLITPHVAATSPYYIDRSLKLFIENLHKFLSHSAMLNVIDKEKGY